MMTLPASSQLDIFNMALNHVGVAPCQSTSENTAQATACNQFWNAALRDVLGNIPWNFATVYATLTPCTTYTNVTNWANVYKYPADCLDLWKVMVPASGSSVVGTLPDIYPNAAVNNWNGMNMQRIKFQVRYDNVNNQVVVLTNASNAIAEYSTNKIDPLSFDGCFITALSLCLAKYIATPLVNDDMKTAGIVKLYDRAMSEAMRMNSEEGNVDKNQESSSFLDARGGGGPVSPQFWNSPSTSQY